VPAGKRFCTGCGKPVGAPAAPVVAAATQPAASGGFATLLMKRLPLMALTFLGSLFLHTYFLAWINDGFQKRSWVSPYIFVEGNGSSAGIIWTTASALLWTFVFGMFRRGPIQTLTDMVQAPIQRFRGLTSGSKPDLGAGIMGAGVALALSSLAPMNPQASLNLAVVWTLLGSSEPGRLLAQFLMRQWPKLVSAGAQHSGGQVKLTIEAVQLMVAGMGPGFLLIRFLPTGTPFLLGVAAVVVGFLMFTGRIGAIAAGQAGMLLAIAAFGSAVYVLMAVLFPEAGYAHDFGRTEAGGSVLTWWNSEGRGQAIGNGAGPSTGASLGPLMPPPKDPRTYDGRSNPWDPSKEDQERMWRDRRVIWDPNTLSWRDPRTDEVPRPPDAPEEPPPFERDRPRDTIPVACLGLYDRYVKAQSISVSGEGEIQAASKAYWEAQRHLNQLLAKLALLLGLDVGSIVGGGVEGIHSVGAGVRAGSTGGRGLISTALSAAKERLAKAMSRLSKVAGELADLAGEIAKKSRVIEGLQNIATEARARAAELRWFVESAASKMAEVAKLDEVAKAAAGVAKKARAAFDAIRGEIQGLEARIRRLEAEKPKWDAWSKAMDEVDQLDKERLALLEAKPTLKAQGEAKVRDLQKQWGKLADEREALRDAGRLEEARQTGKQMEQMESQIDEARSETRRLEAENDARFDAKTVEANAAGARKVSLSDKLDSNLDPREIPQRQNQLAEKQQGLQTAQKELDNAVDAEGQAKGKADAARAVGPDQATLSEKRGQMETLEKNADEAEKRMSEELKGRQAAQEQHSARQKEVDAAKSEADAAQQDIDKHSQSAASEANLPLHERMKPGIVKWLEEQMGRLGGFVQSMVGGQSPQEIANVLTQARQDLQNKLDNLKAIQTAYDDSRNVLRTLKPMLDECIQKNTFYKG